MGNGKLKRKMERVVLTPSMHIQRRGGGLDMVYVHVTLIAFLTLHSMIAREHANVDRVYRDARSRTRDRTGAERGASLS